MLAAENIKGHKTADIAVIGYGLAGAATAIDAHGKGAVALILEKRAAERGLSKNRRGPSRRV